MKKTVSVNIKGINFLIEEDAYELLQDYLDRLTTTLRNESGCSEIIEDVELRIAELCSTKLSDSKTVIELSDINEILANLGDPSDYIDEDSDYAEGQKTESKKTDSDKRLYRDTDNSIIGGVCQGIAGFLNLDVVIIRAIFVVLFLFAGFGFPLYLILWIIVPKAKTTIDRLRMKGRPITVDSVKEEVGNATDRFKEGTKNFSSKMRDNDNYKKTVSRGARILSTIAGVILILWGLSWLITFVVIIVGGFDFIPVIADGDLLSITDVGALILPSTSDVNLAWIGGLMLSISAITFLLLLGTLLVFRIRNKWAKLSLLLIFLTGIVGLIMCIYLGAKTGRDVFYEGEFGKEIGTVHTEELVILPQLSGTSSSKGYHAKNRGQQGLFKIDDKTITSYGIHFTYVQSSDTLFHVHQNLSARGKTIMIGDNRAKGIEHSISLHGDTVAVDTDFDFPRKDKLRDQRVEIIIAIPENGTVRMDNQIIRLGNSHLDDEEFEERIEYYYDENGYMRGNGKYRHYND